ncbi:unnamed protein product [Ixodes persulcatus]
MSRFSSAHSRLQIGIEPTCREFTIKAKTAQGILERHTKKVDGQALQIPRQRSNFRDSSVLLD